MRACGENPAFNLTWGDVDCENRSNIHLKRLSLPASNRVTMSKKEPSKVTAARQLEDLYGRLTDLKENPPSELTYPTFDRLLDELAGEVALLRERVEEGDSIKYQTRLAGIATRLATHFFVERSMPKFCERVLDELIPEVGASSGEVILFSTETSGAKVVAARDAKQQTLAADKLRVSRTILSRIRDGEDSVLVADAISDDGLRDEESVQDFHLRSLLAIPLRFQDYLAGAIYLENEHSADVFTEEDRELLLGVGRLVAIYLNAAFRLSDEVAARRRIYAELKGKTHFDGIVGASPKLLDILATVTQVAPSAVPVVVEGENGTGKELIARAIHAASRRAHKPMVIINCAAIPESLLETELFGHEKGAFTGAFERRIGRFEEAVGGTLFLDEISEMSLPLQAKLLRFLQNGELQRVGGTKTIKVDARLIAATNRDIQALVKSGNFREDLFFRIYVVPIRLPSLRDRADDIPLLVDHFVRVYSLQANREPLDVDADVYEALQYYSWPGNVRELENLVQRMLVFCKGGRIRAVDLPEHVHPPGKPVLETQRNPFNRLLLKPPNDYQELKRRRHELHRLASDYAQRLENEFVDFMLQKTGGNISQAAEQAGMHRTIIHRNLKTRRPSRDA